MWEVTFKVLTIFINLSSGEIKNGDVNHFAMTNVLLFVKIKNKSKWRPEHIDTRLPLPFFVIRKVVEVMKQSAALSSTTRFGTGPFVGPEVS